MKNFHNIDKSAFRQGEYVGYAAGTVWRIRRCENGWCASQRNGGQLFTRRTLAEISAGLYVTASHILSESHL